MKRALCALALALPLLAETKVDRRLSVQTNVDRGIAVALDVSPRSLHDGDTIHVQFALRDEATKTPLTGAHPAAWLAPRTRDCAANVARFLGGSITERAPVDFNNYYVLALNDDASISVVDPRFSFGGSQLLAMIPLESRGEDWALDGNTLYVTQPQAGKVAVIDTTTWKVRATVNAPHATRVAIHDNLAWITGDEITVLNNDRVITRMPGKALAFDDAHTAFVLAESGIVSVDTRDPSSGLRPPSPRKRGEGQRGWWPLAPLAGRGWREAPGEGQSLVQMAWSSSAQMLYLADPDTGRIVAIRRGKVAATINATPGFTQLRFAGRFGFLPNPKANIVQIIDAASNRIVQTADVPDAPDQVTFTSTLAYIRRRDSDSVMMIPLQNVGASDAIGVADFTGGQHALGAGKFTSLADSIVEAPDGPAVLVANPADRSIYYYKEGMAAPMGGFNNGSREPRAVLVVDRSLREKSNGVYATSAVVDDAGKYDVVFFLDSPRVVSCFPLDVAERPETTAKREHAVIVESLAPVAAARVGAPAQIRFRITDASTHQTRAAGEVEIVVMEAPGIWQRRTTATPSQDGSYEIEVTPPSAGTYYVWIASAAAGLPINNQQYIRFEVN
jgi:YVTN family beta-propeller protein